MRVVCTVINDLIQDQRMERICGSLTHAGHDVTLVGRELPDSLPLPERPYRQHRVRCKYLTGKRFYLEYNWKLVKQLNSWDFDVVCSVDVDTLAAGAALTRASARRLVFDAHEWFHMTPEVVDRPLIRGFWRGLARALAPRADLRYTVAPRLAGRLAEDYGVPFSTVRNLPLRKRPPERATERKIILYQGMLNPGRGLEEMLSAMRDLPDCELWIAGHGPLLGELRRCSERMKIAGRVSFLGFIRPEELPALTDQAWLGLNLLDAVSPSYYYSLANKALDYLQSGLPSLQMNFPEYRHIQEQYGCYVLLNELTADTIVTAVRRLSSQPRTYEALQSACLRAAEDLCWEREEEVLLALWQKLR